MGKVPICPAESASDERSLSPFLDELCCRCQVLEIERVLEVVSNSQVVTQAVNRHWQHGRFQ